MSDIDDVLRAAFRDAAGSGAGEGSAPGAGAAPDPSAVLDSIAARVAAGESGTVAHTAPGWGFGRLAWLGTGAGAVVVAGVIGALIGTSTSAVDAAGSPAITPAAVPGALSYECPDGPIAGRVPAGARVLAVGRSEDGSYVAVRNLADYSGTIWLRSADLTADADQTALADLPVAAGCPVVEGVPIALATADAPPTSSSAASTTIAPSPSESSSSESSSTAEMSTTKTSKTSKTTVTPTTTSTPTTSRTTTTTTKPAKTTKSKPTKTTKPKPSKTTKPKPTRTTAPSTSQAPTTSTSSTPPPSTTTTTEPPVDTPPVIDSFTVSPTPFLDGAKVGITVTAHDDKGVTSVTVSWSGVYSGSATLLRLGGTWFGSTGVLSGGQVGDVTFTAVARDAAGNTSAPAYATAHNNAVG